MVGMPLAIPADKAWELKLVFLRELEVSYQKARQNLEELLVHPDSRPSLLGLRDFFHKIAGTSYAADLALLVSLLGFFGTINTWVGACGWMS